jgi:subtilisin-like proprotein convertase family protein
MKKMFTSNLKFNISKNILLIMILFTSIVRVNAQGSLTTTYTLGSGLQLPPSGSGITFVVQNTNATSRVLTQIDQTWDPAFTASPAVVKLWMTTTQLSGIGTGVASPAWTLMATNSNLVVAALGTIPTFTGLSIVIPAGAQYRFAVESSSGVVYGGAGTLPNNFTADGMVLKTGDAQIAAANVGYALNPPPTLANNPRFFGGKITWALETACTGGAFNPGNTISSLASACSGIPFNLSVQNTPVAGTTGITYQWQSSPNGTTYTNIAGATSNTYSATQAAATFYRLVATCSGTPVNSTAVSVPMSTSCYCIPGAITCTLDDEILNVKFRTINNTSSGCTGSGYTNYTSIPAANVFQTASYPISVQVGPGGTEHVGVWIDYNQNGTFETTEFQYLGSANGAVINGNITIPSTAAVGVTRMRVRVQFAAAVTGTMGCTQSSIYGEVEDYSVNISAPPPCTGTPAPGNTVTNVTNACAGVPFNLTIQNIVIASGLSYQWQTGPSATGPWSNVTGATSSSYNGVTLTATTFYRCTVTCGANTGNSVPAQVVLNPTAECYCASSSNSVADEEIFNVTLGTLNNTSTCTTVATGLGSIPSRYSNYANTPGGALAASATDVLAGGANPFSIEVGTCGTFAFTNSVAIWIDFNKNGVFDAAERLYTSPAGTPGAHTERGVLNIPSTALLGLTRMRVISSETGTATTIPVCGGYGFGETEDYIVNLIPCIPVTINAPLANVSAACGSTAAITVPVSGSIPSFQWQYRVSPTAVWQTVPATAPYSGVTTGTLSIAADNAVNGYQYRAFVTGACSVQDVTTVSTLTVTVIPLAITPTFINKCLIDAPVLIAAPSTQNIVSFTNNTPGAVADGDLNGITRTVNVTGVTGPIIKVRVKVNALSSWVGDFVMALKAPNGQIVNIDHMINGTNYGPSGPSPAPPGPGNGFVNTTFNLNRVLRGTPSSQGVVSPAAQGMNNFVHPFTAEYPIDNQLTQLFVGIPTGPTGFAPTTNNIGTFYAHTPASAANGTWTLALYDVGPPDPGAFQDFTLEITYGGAPASIVVSPLTGLFTNAAGTVPYTGTPVTQVYAAPAATTTYSAVISAGTCSTAPQLIPVTVNAPAAGSATLKDTTICANKNASFTLITTALTGGPTFTHQYQVKVPGASTWTNLTNGGVYSGVNTATLTLTNVPDSYNGNVYRDSINTFNSCGMLISGSGKIFVNTTPVVTISAAPITNLLPGLTSTLTAAVSSATAPISYQWLRNGVAITGATTNRYVVGIDALGVYSVRGTDNNGCAYTSSTNLVQPTITIADSVTTGRAANNLFIYPSPNRGTFQVRYFNEGKAAAYVNVYDEKGAMVFSKQFVSNTAYQAMNVDLSGYGKGIYRVDVLTSNGSRINTGSVLVY